LGLFSGKSEKKVGAKIKNGQKKMSKNEKPKKVLKKTLVLRFCDVNAHKPKKITQKNVTITFLKKT
jgi:hypothetical protein